MIKRLDLGKEAIFPLILKMSWPSIVAMIAMSLYNFIDTFWLARLSSQALAALTVCFPIQMIFAAIGVGTGVGAGSFSARMFGAGKSLQAKQTAGQIFSLSSFFGLIMIIFVLSFHDAILTFFGASDEIMPLCRDYLVIIVFSSPFLFFSMMLKSSKYELKWEYLFPNISIINSIYSTGFPSIAANLIVSLVLVVYNHVLANFGSLAIAALGICFRVNGLITMVLFGIGFGLMPIVGFNDGARLYQRLKESVFVALKVSISFAAVSSTILEIFAPQIVGFFSKDPALLAIAIPALRIYVSVLILIAPIMMFINMFLGLGKGTLAMFLLFFRDSILLIPLLLILSSSFGLFGAWLALPLANLLAFFAVLFWAKKDLRRFGTN